MSNVPVIFLAFSNDKETAGGYLRNLTKERNLIREALKTACTQAEPLCELIVEPDVSLDRIFDIFQDINYRDRIAIFHYGGHADDYQLLLENSIGKKSYVDTDGLISFLSAQIGLELIFLNGCSTQAHAEELIAAGIPAVIGTTRKISDRAASSISERFYKGLGAGLNIQLAWQAASARARSERSKVPKGAVIKLGNRHGHLPWQIYYQLNPKKIKEWSLPKASGNALFGLPELDNKYFLSLPSSPYLGLRRFEQAHAGIFFGRNTEIRLLYEKLDNIYPIILYHGQSGVGKSSILEAGLIPRIENTHFYKIARRDPNLGLSGTMDKALRDILISQEPDQSTKTIPADSMLNLWQTVENKTEKPILLILDQAEEAFTKPWQNDEDEWDVLISNLIPLSQHLSGQGKGKIILSFRTEYFAQIQHHLDQNGTPYTHVFLDRLKLEGALEAISGVNGIEQTINRYGLKFDNKEYNLPRIIANDLLRDKDSPIAPTLQILMEKLWKKSKKMKDGTHIITLESYEKEREEGLALSDYLDEKLSDLKKLNNENKSVFYQQEIVESGFVLDLLMHFVTQKNTAGTKLKSSILELYPHRSKTISTLLDFLVEVRLLTPIVDVESQIIGLSHDTLAPVVRTFFDASNKPGQRAKLLLQGKKGVTNQDEIFDDMDLDVVEKGKSGMQEWSSEEYALIERSKKSRDKKVRLKKRRKRLTVAAILAIAGFGLIASYLGIQANREAFISKANSLAYKALTLLDSDHTLALNLCIEAYNMNSNQETGAALSKITQEVDALYLSSFKGHQSFVNSAVFSPDGKYILTGSDDNTAKLWTLDGQEKQTFTGYGNYVSNAVFSSKGNYIVTECDVAAEVDTVKIWNLEGKELHAIMGHTGILSPDGTSILTLDSDPIPLLWSIEGELAPESSFWDENDITKVHSAFFSPDGQFIFTCSQNNAKMWTRDGQLVRKFGGHKNLIWKVAISSDNQHIITLGGESGRLWTREGMLIHTFNDKVYDALFSPDGKYLLTLSLKTYYATIWDLQGRVLNSFKCHDGQFGSVPAYGPGFSAVFTPDANYIMTCSSTENIAKLWSLEGELVRSFIGHSAPLSTVAISANGKYAVTASKDSTAILWPIENKNSQFLSGYEEELIFSEFSPDGKFIVTIDMKGTASLWTRQGKKVRDIVLLEEIPSLTPVALKGNFMIGSGGGDVGLLWTLEGDEVAIFVGHNDQVTCFAFQKTGNLILTGSLDYTASLWTMEGKEVQTFYGHQDEILSVAFSENEKNVLTFCADNKLFRWNLDGEIIDSIFFPEIEEILRTSEISDEILLAKFSPDGEFLCITMIGANAMLYSTKSGKLISTLGQGLGKSMIVVFSPNGQYILTGGLDNTVKLRNLNGDAIQSFVCEDFVQSLSFSPDGKHILAGLRKGSVHIWPRWDIIQDSTLIAPLTAKQKIEFGID